MENKTGLIKRIFWTKQANESLDSDKKNEILSRCSQLEEEGFGMLASDFDQSRVDESESVVFPNGSIFSPKQIEEYWYKRRGNYSSKNPEDLQMHNAQIYYLGFKGEI